MKIRQLLGNLALCLLFWSLFTLAVLGLFRLLGIYR
jgi:hypothetical protein